MLMGYEIVFNTRIQDLNAPIEIEDFYFLFFLVCVCLWGSSPIIAFRCDILYYTDGLLSCVKNIFKKNAFLFKINH